ncbi:MAG: NUDIX domain-containing protein, partial [Erysipelotrichaceae bacterium]|nr:NUDIX domain-containing protein [Erysipelotrichaceae bacterium]
VFCRHKQRITYEIPGGHRENGESIDETAKRELTEETGALEFDIQTLCDYSVQSDDKINYGRVYVANIELLGELPDSEIGEVIISEELPEKWTYPEIQMKFIEKYIKK